MLYFHSVMVKKHNVTILHFLLSHKNAEFTIRTIAQKVNLDYKAAYLAMQELIHAGVISSRRAGQSILCSFNRNAFTDDVFSAELQRREELLNNKSLRTVYAYFKDVKNPFFILLLFGSRSSGTARQRSDIDVLLITDNDAVRDEMKRVTSLIPLNIHLIDFMPTDFVSMLKTTDFNVGKEAFGGVILFGIEDYYRLIAHA